MAKNQIRREKGVEKRQKAIRVKMDPKDGRNLGKRRVRNPKSLRRPIAFKRTHVQSKSALTQKKATPPVTMQKVSGNFAKTPATKMAAGITSLGPTLQDASKKQVKEESKGLPDFKIDVLGEKDLAQAQDVKLAKPFPIRSSSEDPKKPGESSDKAQKSTMDSAKKQIETQGQEATKTAQVDIKPVQMDAKKELDKQLDGKLDIQTPVPKEVQEFANQDIPKEAAPGIDKELQPKLNKTMGTMQKDIQEGEKKPQVIQSSQSYLVNESTPLFYTKLILLSLIIIGAGIFLSTLGSQMALPVQQGGFGLQASFIGTLFLALSTSLPELVIACSCLRYGSADMAVGNIIGSNSFNLLILCLGDLLLKEELLLNHASSNHLLSFSFIAILSLFGLIILRYPRTIRIGSFLILLSYLFVVLIQS